MNATGAANGGGSCPMTISVTSGNTGLALIATNSGASTQGVSDTDGDTFTIVGTQQTTGSVVFTPYSVKFNTTNAAEVVTMTNTNTAANESCAIAWYAGAAATSPVDKFSPLGTFSATTSLVTGTTATTTQANEMVVAFFVGTGMNGATITAGASYTVREDSHADGVCAVFIEDQSVSSIGTFQGTATATSPGTGGGIVVTLVPPGAVSSAPNAHATIL